VPDAVVQKKAVRSGEVRSWELDLEAMAAAARWSRRQPGLLQAEVEQLQPSFPTLVAALGSPLSEDEGWIEAAEPMLCPSCRDELVVFDRGTRCAACSRQIEPPQRSVVGFVGRIPALISGRPFLDQLDRRLARMGSRDPRIEIFKRSLLQVGGKTYLAPRFGIWFSRSWPHADPPVMVWPEYFDLLDLPPDHVYMAPPYYRLCLYARWLEQPLCSVLQNRVVPRLLIDLMMADLKAMGKLDLALARLDASLYEVYNMVGHPEQGDELRQVYEDLLPQRGPG